MKVGRGNPHAAAPRRSRPAAFGRGIFGSGVRLGMSEFSMDWLNSRNWRLPSGQALAEFALQAGFLAPLLLKTEQLRPAVSGPARTTPEKEPAPKPSGQPARPEATKTGRGEGIR